VPEVEETTTVYIYITYPHNICGSVHYPDSHGICSHRKLNGLPQRWNINLVPLLKYFD